MASTRRTGESGRAGFWDYACAAPVAGAATANLWKIESVRNLVPIDITLLSFAVLALTTFLSAARDPRFLGGIVPLASGLIFFVPGLALAGFAQPYSLQKSVALFTLVPLLLISAMQLMHTPQRRHALSVVLGLIGVAVAAGLEMAGTASVAAPERMGLQDANVIGLARVCALGAVALVFLPGRPVLRLTYLLGAGLCLHSAATTGSRGPIVAALLAILVATVVTGGNTPEARRRTRLVMALVAGLVVFTLSPGSRLLTANGGETDIVRVSLANASLNVFGQHPMGVGWGDFVEVMPLGLRDDLQGWAQYPHNIVLEAAVEGGIFGLFGLLLLVARAAKPLVTVGRAGHPASLALLITSLAAALTSSDLTGNRAVWTFIGVGLATMALPATRKRPVKARDYPNRPVLSTSHAADPR